MFEKFFNRPKSPEDNEREVGRIISEELANGVNKPSMQSAFDAAREKNREENLGLTDNQIINMVRDIAIAHADNPIEGAIDNELYGGRDKTIENIEGEIARIRKEVMDEKHQKK